MTEPFRLGGWGMWPTTLFGLVTLAAAVVFALRGDGRSRSALDLPVWIAVVAGLWRTKPQGA